MTARTNAHPTLIRDLGVSDAPEITEHFLRLDHDTRRARFLGAVSDDHLRHYARGILEGRSLAYGAIVDGRIRAIAELHILHASRPASAEVALSVEPDWQNIGIGDALFGHLIAIAHHEGIRVLHLTCLPENHRLRHIAVKHRSRLIYGRDSVDATLDLGRSPRVFLENTVETIRGFRRKLGQRVWRLFTGTFGMSGP